MVHHSIERHAQESLGTEVLQDDVVGDLVRQAQRERDVKTCPLRDLHDRVADRLNRVGLDLATALRAEGVTDPGPQQAEVVVDLGRGADGRP